MSLTSDTPRNDLQARLKRVSRNTWIIAIALLVYGVLSTLILSGGGAVPHFRVEFSPLLNAGLTVKVHVTAAVTTLSIGIILLCAPKGLRLHRTLGWIWVLTMAVTAGSSFLLTGLIEGHYSPIHALSAWTMIGLPMGLAAIRRKDVRAHRKQMTGMFVGGMLVAGLFSFLPGRLMWHVFFTV